MSAGSHAVGKVMSTAPCRRAGAGRRRAASNGHSRESGWSGVETGSGRPQAPCHSMARDAGSAATTSEMSMTNTNFARAGERARVVLGRQAPAFVESALATRAATSTSALPSAQDGVSARARAGGTVVVTEAAANVILGPSSDASPFMPNELGESPRPPDESLDGKIGVLLLNLGGPDSLEDVQPFLYNLFADPDIIRLPEAVRFLQEPLASIISTLRAPKSQEGYASIGGGSPLREMTEQQASAIEQSLNRAYMEGVRSMAGTGAVGDDLATDPKFKVFVGMRYWHPFTEEAIESIKRENVSRLVILPLYPQFSVSTSGSSLRLLEKLFREDDELSQLPHIVIPSWYQRPGYIESMCDLIFGELAGFSNPDEATIFFSAHGVPKSYVEEAGDPYKEEMEECIQLIMKELRDRGVPNSFQLAYQSRVGPVEWLKPYTDDTIRLLGASGCRSMLAVPISFVSEHIETLEEIDMEYRDLAIESGIKEWRRVPALGVNQKFIDDLSQAVIDAVPYMGSVSTSSRAAQMRPPADKELVPSGSVEDLLNAFDAERLSLPSTESLWEWGWTRSAEVWNGRIAMVACVLLIINLVK